MSSGSPADAVAVKVASPTPDTMAWTVLVPIPGPSVQVVDACPASSVVPVVGFSEPPPPVTTQVTAAPTTGLALPSSTSTTRGSGSVDPGAPDWPLPETIRTPDGFPAVTVWVKTTGEPAKGGSTAEL